jgi:hypothetical protein
MHKNKENLLKFGTGNAKLRKNIYTFSLPSGYTCPGARDCLAKADVDTGRIIDGPHQKFRCFSATDETRPNVRRARWHNFYMLTACRDVSEMANLILASLPEDAAFVRIHVAGDFYSQNYFDAWLEVTQKRPATTFYAYTKSVHFVKARWDRVQQAENFRLTSSNGGKFDHYAEELGMFQAYVVLHPQEAEGRDLEIDHDDSHAITNDRSFALLIHGTQAQGSQSAEAIRKLKQENIKFSYTYDSKPK